MRRTVAVGIALLFLLQIFFVQQFTDDPQNFEEKPLENREEQDQAHRTRNDDGLVAQWHFDEGRGGTAGDDSVNGNNGTLLNMGSNSWVDGRRKTGLEFDGVDDYVETPFSDYNSVIVGTIEMWIRPNEYTCLSAISVTRFEGL